MPHIRFKMRSNIICTETRWGSCTFFDGESTGPMIIVEPGDNVMILGIRAIVLKGGVSGEHVYLTVRDGERPDGVFLRQVPVASLPPGEKGLWIFAVPLRIKERFLVDVFTPVEPCDVRLTVYGLRVRSN